MKKLGSWKKAAAFTDSLLTFVKTRDRDIQNLIVYRVKRTKLVCIFCIMKKKDILIWDLSCLWMHFLEERSCLWLIINDLTELSISFLFFVSFCFVFSAFFFARGVLKNVSHWETSGRKKKKTRVKEWDSYSSVLKSSTLRSHQIIKSWERTVSVWMPFI